LKQEEVEVLLKRIVVAVIFIPLIIFFVVRGGFLFFLLVCAIVGCGLYEFYRTAGRGKGLTGLGIFLGMLMCLSFYGRKGLPFILAVVIFSLFFAQFFEFKTKRNSTNAFINIGGVLYVSFLFSHILLLRDIPGVGTKLTLTVLFVTWMGDTGAYFIGERWGKHRLFPQISPHKSKEGFLGAVLVSLLAMFISQLWLSLPPIHILTMGILTGTMGQRISEGFFPDMGGFWIDSTVCFSPFPYSTIMLNISSSLRCSVNRLCLLFRRVKWGFE